MRVDTLKNDKNHIWTRHVKQKMTFYGLSPQRIKRVINAPVRTEVDVIPGTTMSMQHYGSSKDPKEIWVLFATPKPPQDNNPDRLSALLYKPRIKIISAWRYPGVSAKRSPDIIPEEIRQEIVGLV